MKLVVGAALFAVSFAFRARTFDRRSRTTSALTGQLAKDTCNSFPNALEIVFPANARWGYAGVEPNPNYLCIGPLDSNPEDEVMIYAFDYAGTKTSCFFDHVINGCWFAFAWDCLDPVLRQDIFDSQICTFQGTAQEVADRLSAAINRLNYINYMVVVVHLDSFEAWSSPFDDNMCSVFTESTDYQIIISKVAVR